MDRREGSICSLAIHVEQCVGEAFCYLLQSSFASRIPTFHKKKSESFQAFRASTRNLVEKSAGERLAVRSKIPNGINLLDQPGKVANPARGQLNSENKYLSSPFAPDNLASRDGFSRPVLRQPSYSPNLKTESGAYSRDSSRFPRRRPFIYLNSTPAQGQQSLR